VYLDMRHVAGIDLDARFPGISTFLHQHGLDLARDLIPVRPAAHYLMGGVRTDVDGRTSLPGLYAAGEVACTGVHGANRLASNSLLEGLVFGARAAESMRRESAVPIPAAETAAPPLQMERSLAPVEIAIQRLQQQMWEHAGLLRDAELLKTIDLSAAADYAEAVPPAQWTRREYEAQSLARVAGAIVRCALAREESRGAHFRNDYPQRDDARFGTHSHLADDVVSFGPLLPAQNESNAQPESPALR
jgi:L-aspartate oxidase